MSGRFGLHALSEAPEDVSTLCMSNGNSASISGGQSDYERACRQCKACSALCW